MGVFFFDPPRVHVGRKKKKKTPILFYFQEVQTPQKFFAFFVQRPRRLFFFFIYSFSFLLQHALLQRKMPSKNTDNLGGVAEGGYRYFTDKLKIGLRHISKRREFSGPSKQGGPKK